MLTDMDPTGGGGAFDAMVVVVPVIAVLGVVSAIAVAVYRAVRLAKSGQNPLTLDQDLAVRALHSKLLAPTDQAAPEEATQTASVEDRLARLDDMHARGLISDEERRTARADILRG
jgi:hypothetical protein